MPLMHKFESQRHGTNDRQRLDDNFALYNSRGTFLSTFARDDGTIGSAEIQAAVNECLSVHPPRDLLWDRYVTVPAGFTPVNIDRAVGQLDEFNITGINGGGVFFTGNCTLFDSNIAMGGAGSAPVSEFVNLNNMQFRGSSVFNLSYVFSRKFLRLKIRQCVFALTPFMTSNSYLQQIEFLSCNIRNYLQDFLHCDGMYSVSFMGGAIENGFTLINNVSTVRGANGVQFGGGITIEGCQTSVMISNGVDGFSLSGGYHIEENAFPMFNFFAGGVANGTVGIGPGFMLNNPGGIFYYGPTAKVVSTGVKCGPNGLHTNTAFVTELVSVADECPAISDQPWDVEIGSVKIKTPNPGSRTVPKFVALPYTASMTPDARAGITNGVLVTSNAAHQFNVPSNPVDGAEVLIWVFNVTGAPIAAATFPGYKISGAFVPPAANTSRWIRFAYNFAQWREAGRATADIPN